jgi:hypothetical protein
MKEIFILKNYDQHDSDGLVIPLLVSAPHSISPDRSAQFTPASPVRFRFIYT